MQQLPKARIEFQPPGNVPFSVLNLGNSSPVKLSQLIAALEAATGKQAIRDQQPAQPGDVPITWADISKARQLLGYSPKTTLAEGLQRFVGWYRALEESKA